jgi:HSP20 family molecular chaperone IbpA
MAGGSVNRPTGRVVETRRGEGDLVNPMKPVRTIQLRWLGTAIGDVTVTRVHYWRGTPHVWQPAMNAFRCERAISICLDLAGIDRSHIDVRVESSRVIVRGVRPAPEPRDHPVKLLALEIDYGPFERVIELPADAEVDVDRAGAEQKDGLLWIHLPIKS